MVEGLVCFPLDEALPNLLLQVLFAAGLLLKMLTCAYGVVPGCEKELPRKRLLAPFTAAAQRG